MERLKDCQKTRGLEVIADWLREQFPSATRLTLHVTYKNHEIVVEADTVNSFETLDGSLVGTSEQLEDLI